jgi:predicted outer membrane protein
MTRIVAALALLACVACGAGEPTKPGPDAAQTAADSTFVAALRARLEAATQAGEFSGAVLVTRDAGQ